MTNFIGQDWDTLMESYLKEFGHSEQLDSEISSLFFKLSKMLEINSRLFWHIKSFQDYIGEAMTPLGLRVQIFPTLEDMDSDFKTQWEKVLCTCSLCLMELLICDYNKRSLVLDIDNVSVCDKLQLFKTQINTRQGEKTYYILRPWTKKYWLKKGINSDWTKTLSKVEKLINGMQINIQINQQISPTNLCFSFL